MLVDHTLQRNSNWSLSSRQFKFEPETVGVWVETYLWICLDKFLVFFHEGCSAGHSDRTRSSVGRTGTRQRRRRSGGIPVKTGLAGSNRQIRVKDSCVAGIGYGTELAREMSWRSLIWIYILNFMPIINMYLVSTYIRHIQNVSWFFNCVAKEY